MGKKVTFFSTSGQDRAAWEALCPTGEYRIVPPSSLPPVALGSGLFANADSALVAASGSSQGTVVFMVNVNRLEQDERAIDQQPFGIVFHGPTPAESGVLLHHGNWSGRTSTPPPVFWDAVAASGIGGCYPFSGIPAQPAGPISALQVPSQHAAFGALLTRLKGSLTSGP
jgi:hypothetical protein